MRMFKCDICKKPFDVNNKNINMIRFETDSMDMRIGTHDAMFNKHQLPNPANGSSLAIYHICPECFCEIKRTLWSLREKAEPLSKEEEKGVFENDK